MSSFADVAAGLIQRGLEFGLHELLPGVAGMAPGPFGSLLGAALHTQYAQDLEASLAGKAAALSSAELAKLEAACQSWVDGFLRAHPEAQAFWAAVKPEQLPTFQLRTDEMWAVLADIKAGSLRAKLGLSAVAS